MTYLVFYQAMLNIIRVIIELIIAFLIVKLFLIPSSIVEENNLDIFAITAIAISLTIALISNYIENKKLPLVKNLFSLFISFLFIPCLIASLFYVAKGSFEITIREFELSRQKYQDMKPIKIYKQDSVTKLNCKD